LPKTRRFESVLALSPTLYGGFGSVEFSVFSRLHGCLSGSVRSSRRAAASRGCAGYRRSLTVAVAVIAGLFWAPRPAAADDAPTAFIGSLGQQVLAVIHRPDLPVDGKAAYFRQLLRQDFDLTGISRFVLGPYWRVASPGERQEFSDLLTQQIIDVYDRRLAQAGDGNFVVSGSRTDPGGVIVTSRIIPGRARRSLWIGGSRSATAITRSRVSPSTGSAWR
jgi:hypothetical protein